MRSTILPTLAFLLPVLLTSCTASLDLERFKQQDQAASTGISQDTPYVDFKLAATTMASHTNEYFELRVLDNANHIRSKAIYDGITQVNFNLYMKRWIPTDPGGAPYRVDFWADHNLTHKYDGIVGDVATKDHAWRRVLGDPLPKDVLIKSNRYEFSFLHDTTFVDIATDLNGVKLTGSVTSGDGIPGDGDNLPFQLTVTGADTIGVVGKKLEIRVFNKDTNQMIAMHRRGRAADPYVAEVFGLLDTQQTYLVQAYVDLDEDGLYNPATETSWSTEITSKVDGIHEQFNLATLPIVPIETGDLTAPAPK